MTAENESSPNPPFETPDWDRRYIEGNTPWDSRLPSRELARVLDAGLVLPCRAVELGCGAGTNAVYLAKRGFAVTAVDGSEAALKLARERAAEAGASADFRLADVCDWRLDLPPFDFIFDRGCYHSVRRVNLPGFIATLRLVTKPGAKCLLLTGNANEQTEFGPPRVHEHEIRAELSGLFDIDWIRPFRFQDKGGVDGPLGWSCLMTRRPQS